MTRVDKCSRFSCASIVNHRRDVLSDEFRDEFMLIWRGVSQIALSGGGAVEADSLVRLGTRAGFAKETPNG